MKRRLMAFTIIVCFWVSSAHGFFEDKYFCGIQGNVITVGLKPDLGRQRCLRYLQSIQTQLTELDVDLVQTKQYLQADPTSTYRINVNQKLLNRITALKTLRSKIMASMKSFESELFINIKKVVVFRLQVDLVNYREQVAAAQLLYTGQITQGQTTGYDEIRQLWSNYEIKKGIIDHIGRTTNFAQLVPRVQHYLTYSRQQLGGSGSLFIQ